MNINLKIHNVVMIIAIGNNSMKNKGNIQSFFFFINKFIHIIILKTKNIIYNKLVYYKLWSNGVTIGKNFRASGIPIIHLSFDSQVTIGNNCTLRSWAKFSDTGENRPTVIRTRNQGCIHIGDNTGITSTLLFSESKIIIGQNVKIGGGTRIFDTNFHSTDASIRASKEDTKHVKSLPIIIGDNVFIGTGCIITKGVTIGENSIIAAGSVVVRSVPANQIWGGNPAKFIKEI